MQYKVITDPNLKERGQWDDFNSAHPQGNIFQSFMYYEAVLNTNAFDPHIFIVFDANDNIVGGMVAVIQKEHKGLVGYFSSRSIIQSGPLVKDDDPQILSFLLSFYFKNIKRRAIYSQFRNSWEQSYEKTVFSNLKADFFPHLNILVDLTKSKDDLWKDVHSKRRNEIRRAIKEGTSVRRIQNNKELHSAYEILKEVYQRVKIPLPKLRFFEELFTELNKIDLMQCFIALNDNQIIGTMIVFSFGETIYDWYAGAKQEAYKKYPNDLIPWVVFEWGKENGYQKFDFGGAGKPDEKYGVRDYKKKFGGDFVSPGRYEIVHNKLLMMLGKLAYKIYKKV